MSPNIDIVGVIITWLLAKNQQESILMRPLRSLFSDLIKCYVTSWVTCFLGSRLYHLMSNLFSWIQAMSPHEWPVSLDPGCVTSWVTYFLGSRLCHLMSDLFPWIQTVTSWVTYFHGSRLCHLVSDLFPWIQAMSPHEWSISMDPG